MIRNAIVVVLFLLIPLGLTIRDGAIEGVGWNWTLSDFIFAFILLFGASVSYELIARKLTKTSGRVAVGVIIMVITTIIWVELATHGVSRTVKLILG